MRYVVRKIDRDEWLVSQPGGRLDSWGPFADSAVFGDIAHAFAMIRVHGAESFAMVIGECPVCKGKGTVGSKVVDTDMRESWEPEECDRCYGTGFANA